MYTPSPSRYDSMPYNKCGKWGLKLPAISLGFWHNFGDGDDLLSAPGADTAERVVWRNKWLAFLGHDGAEEVAPKWAEAVNPPHAFASASAVTLIEAKRSRQVSLHWRLAC